MLNYEIIWHNLLYSYKLNKKHVVKNDGFVQVAESSKALTMFNDYFSCFCYCISYKEVNINNSLKTLLMRIY